MRLGWLGWELIWWRFVVVVGSLFVFVLIGVNVSCILVVCWGWCCWRFVCVRVGCGCRMVCGCCRCC